MHPEIMILIKCKTRNSIVFKDEIRTQRKTVKSKRGVRIHEFAIDLESRSTEIWKLIFLSVELIFM